MLILSYTCYEGSNILDLEMNQETYIIIHNSLILFEKRFEIRIIFEHKNKI